MTRTVIKRSVIVNGHKTSITIEGPFWAALKEIADERHVTVYRLVGQVDKGRENGNLSSAIRLFVLNYYTALAASLHQRTKP